MSETSRMTGKNAPIALRPARSCPICGGRSTRDAYPFCSTRCADIDLGRWLKGSYVISGEDTADAEDRSADQE